MPVPLDEFPIHQTPQSLAFVGSSDRNFYDRWYFNAHDRSGDVFLVTGAGFYPNLGVKDAYAAVRVGSRQWVVRCSDAIDDDRLHPAVGPYRVEVVDPLRQIRIVCDAADRGVGFDLTWEGSFPAIDEERHQMRSGRRSIIDTWRFAQVGSWSGTLVADGHEYAVDPDTWLGTRDRSWGIRPVGESEPAGRPNFDERYGFWWLYVPLRFDGFAIVVIAQEDGEGHRTLNDAVRIWPDGRTDQLGWPRVEIDYRSGTRDPQHARIHLSERDGSPLVLEVDASCGVPLHVGCGYGGDSEWLHGSWRGPGWIEGRVYDFDDPAVAGRVPWGVIDHVARASIGDHVGYGLFEHGTIGRHAPSGFADLRQRKAVRLVDQGVRLQSGEQEHEAFDQIDDQIPEEDALQPRRRRDQPRPVPAHIQAAGDGGEHAGAAEMCRNPERDIGCHQRQGDFDTGVVRPFAQHQAEPAHRHAPEDFADDDQREGAGRLCRREGASRRRGDGEAIEDQRGGVIGEAFAFQNHDQPARQAEPAGDSKRRHGVGWRDDGAEHEGDRPRELQQVMHRRGDGAGREHDAAEGQQSDRPQVEAEFAPAHGDAGRIDQRRQEHQQHQFGRQIDRRQARNQRHADAGDDQQDRWRDVQPPRRHRDGGEHGHHQQHGLGDGGHVELWLSWSEGEMGLRRIIHIPLNPAQAGIQL